MYKAFLCTMAVHSITYHLCLNHSSYHHYTCFTIIHTVLIAPGIYTDTYQSTSSCHSIMSTHGTCSPFCKRMRLTPECRGAGMQFLLSHSMLIVLFSLLTISSHFCLDRVSGAGHEVLISTEIFQSRQPSSEDVHSVLA